MARTRLIAIATPTDAPDKILGCASLPHEALLMIVAEHPKLYPEGQLFYEDPDNAYPKMIQVRFAQNREARHLGRILVDRGSVDTVLAELRKGEQT